MHILTSHQPVYIPWLGLFHKIMLADTFCFFDNVQYQHKDWNNRNYIKSGDNSKILLSIPIFNKGYLEKKYLDIKISTESGWQKKHLRSIELNYRKAPYFDLYYNDIKLFYTNKYELLSELNFEMLQYFLKVLDIEVKIVRMKDYAFKGRKDDLVLDMCMKLNSDLFIFGTLGKDYASVDKFNQNNIKVYFQEYNHPIYNQPGKTFTSHLSVLDLLFNCGPDSKNVIMQNNITKNELIQMFS